MDHMSGLAAVFRDRTEAGRLLAERLAGRGLEDPVVYALPRGGAPVAVEIARALGAPLDLLLVRKIGAPGQPELALAAIVEGEQTPVVNEEVWVAAGAHQAFLDEAVRRELAEIDRRRGAYL